MAWKLRKDKLQADAAKEETDGTVAGEKAPDAFSLHDTAIEGQTLAPDASAHSFDALDLAREGHTQGAPEDPHFSEDPKFLNAEPTFTEPATLEPKFTEDPEAFSPFVPFQSEEPQPSPHPFLNRDDVASSLILPSDGDGIPRVAPFIVDVPPVAGAPTNGGRLVVRIGNLSADFTLTKDVTTIGRPDGVAQSYPDVEIELDDAVSRRHAEIRHRDDEYFLVDLMSTNGTLLNGQRVAGDQEQRLLHGDRIRMGDRTEIVFE